MALWDRDNWCRGVEPSALQRCSSSDSATEHNTPRTWIHLLKCEPAMQNSGLHCSTLRSGMQDSYEAMSKSDWNFRNKNNEFHVHCCIDSSDDIIVLTLYHTHAVGNILRFNILVCSLFYCRWKIRSFFAVLCCARTRLAWCVHTLASLYLTWQSWQMWGVYVIEFQALTCKFMSCTICWQLWQPWCAITVKVESKVMLRDQSFADETTAAPVTHKGQCL